MYILYTSTYIFDILAKAGLHSHWSIRKSQLHRVSFSQQKGKLYISPSLILVIFSFHRVSFSYVAAGGNLGSQVFILIAAGEILYHTHNTLFLVKLHFVSKKKKKILSKFIRLKLFFFLWKFPNTVCEFKLKGYNIINAAMADRQVVVECQQLFLRAGSQYTPFVVPSIASSSSGN